MPDGCVLDLRVGDLEQRPPPLSQPEENVIQINYLFFFYCSDKILRKFAEKGLESSKKNEQKKFEKESNKIGNYFLLYKQSFFLNKNSEKELKFLCPPVSKM